MLLDLKNLPSDAEIHEWVGKFGPFIHMALFWSREQRERFEDLRQKELACIFASDASVTHAEANLSRVMETSKVNTGSVHCFTRYLADPDSDDSDDCLESVPAVQRYHVCTEIM